MKKLIYIVIGVWLCVTGCKPMQSVSSIDLSKFTKDSLVTSSTKFDSSISIVTTNRTAETFDFNIGNGKRLDSIIDALKALPKGVPKVIYVNNDKPNSNQVVLFLLDSLGKLHAHVSTLEEKNVRHEHYISTLTNELSKKNEQNFTLTKENAEAKKTVWQNLKEGVDHWLIKLLIWFILVGFGVMMAEYGLAYLKNLNWFGWFGSIGKLFKRKN